MSGINKVAVIGSGVMGAGIAAHFANAGVQVLLLDVVSDQSGDRSERARSAIERMARGRGAQLADPTWVDRLQPGNLEDDLAALTECDWVVEVVLEDLGVKRALYQRLLPYLRADAVLSSNTSTLPLADLTAQLPAAVRARFLITHFFNPPRQMRLIELVTGPATDPAMVARIWRFADLRLGKTVVPCNDRPGFIANRLGGFWMTAAAAAARACKVTVEEADAVLSRPFGVPATGAFGLMDLIGVDLMERSRRSMAELLAPDDPQRILARDLTLFAEMSEAGLTGRKAGAGFLRRAPGGEEVLDLDLRTYRPRQLAPKLPGSFGQAFVDRSGDRLADFAWAVMGPTLAYAARCLPEITASPADVDTAMELGYNWRSGPFKLIDSIGADKIVARLQAEGQPVPPLLEQAARCGGFYRGTGAGREVLMPGQGWAPVPRPQGVLLAADLTAAPLIATETGRLLDMGDGVALFSIATRNGTLDDRVMADLDRALDIASSKYRAMVIGSDAAQFSVGADLNSALLRTESGALDEVARQLELGQSTLLRMKYAPIPVVCAASGLALGGGCEILMHATQVVAHLDATPGLVEANVGLIPAWGGTTALLLNLASVHGDVVAGACAAFDVISAAQVAAATPQAVRCGYLRDTTEVVMNRDRLLARAKAAALALAAHHAPPEEATIVIDSAAVQAALAPRLADLAARSSDAPHTVEIARELCFVLTGGGQSGRFGEAALHRLEAAAMMRLIAQTQSQDRMRHMLATGRALKN